MFNHHKEIFQVFYYSSKYFILIFLFERLVAVQWLQNKTKQNFSFGRYMKTLTGTAVDNRETDTLSINPRSQPVSLNPSKWADEVSGLTYLSKYKYFCKHVDGALASAFSACAMTTVNHYHANMFLK